MDIDKMEEALRRLVLFMNSNCLAEVELDDGDVRIRIKKGAEAVSGAPQATATAATSAVSPTPASAPGEPPEKNLVEIPSPLVGTFYRSPAPDAPPFVDAGDEVDTDTVLCIVEAMKVMNEIKSEVSGTIVEVLVESGQPVEYGQPLFLIEPKEEA
jgi:acetyl-CoA carboxylase biotin carboxyl carrier protein